MVSVIDPGRTASKLWSPPSSSQRHGRTINGRESIPASLSFGLGFNASPVKFLRLSVWGCRLSLHTSCQFRRIPNWSLNQLWDKYISKIFQANALLLLLARLFTREFYLSLALEWHLQETRDNAHFVNCCLSRSRKDGHTTNILWRSNVSELIGLPAM